MLKKKIFSGGNASINYQNFLLNFLEYDYAGILKKLKTTQFVKNSVKINDLNDINIIPLGLLLLIKTESIILKESNNYELYNILCTKFRQASVCFTIIF